MPKISIIIPVYNVEKRLPYCLDSLIQQTFTDFEAVCVNDGSSDNSLNVLTAYAQKDSRFKVISQENKGQAEARNTGLENATGEYICYLDSDDYFHPQYLEILYDYAVKHNADLVCVGYERVEGYETHYSKIDKNTIAYQIYDNPVLVDSMTAEFNVWAKLYRKDFFADIKYFPYSIMEDGIYIYEVFSKKPKTVDLKLKLYFYVNNLISVSHKPRTQQQLKEYNKSLQYILNLYKDKNLTAEFDVLIKTFVPTILGTQLKHCRRAPQNIRKEMFDILRAELKDLNNQGLLKRQGHKLNRYIMYKLLLWGLK